jgi:hypothetical protein
VAEPLPWELRLTLRGGSVYYFADRALFSPEPHYFIVINAHPVEQRLLALLVVTSQIEKVKRWRRDLPETCVEIGPADYQELSVASIVDCNNVFRRSIRELLEKIEAHQVGYKSDVSQVVLEKLRAAVLASPLVEDEIKNLLR